MGLSHGESFLQLSHVNVARGDAIVLHDIHLSVNAGEHIAILGPNGCGKSTLIKTITCECYPIFAPEMRCRLLGRERWDVSQLRKHLGVVWLSLDSFPHRLSGPIFISPRKCRRARRRRWR